MIKRKNNILVIPLDNRPVCYLLPRQIAQINKNTNILMPPRGLLGGLNYHAQIDKILNWIKSIDTNVDAIVCALDTIAYGGLISSRRINKDYDRILSDLKTYFFEFKNNKFLKNAKIYAFSSIMRMSDSNINEEEKLYWDKYGKLIFNYSVSYHKFTKNFISKDELALIKRQIPEDILKDYLDTRERNFLINKKYLNLLELGSFDELIFSRDDTAQEGINIIEAEEINNLINNKNLSKRCKIHTGTDEIISSLLIRSVIKENNEKINIYPIYSTVNGANIISRYEDKTISQAVENHINLAGAKISTNKGDADLILLVHTPEQEQNDHTLNIYTEQTSVKAIEFCIDTIKNSDKPFIIADISSANGADNLLIKELLDNNYSLSKISGYAGWNTTGNTLGSVISMGLNTYISQKYNSFNEQDFKKLLTIRFIDDWAYQANCRQIIRESYQNANKDTLKKLLRPYIQKILKKTYLPLKEIEVKLPWGRTFEVDVQLGLTDE